MKLNKKIKLFLLVIVIVSSFSNLHSQNNPVKPTRQSSKEAFLKGDYELAYSEFSELLLTYSKDPLYKYYSGVCLVKLKRNPAEAVQLLKEALQGAAIVKTLPSDALFFLGRAQQMSGKYSEASESYNLYTEQVGKKTAKEQGVPELLIQCNEKKGAVSVQENKPAEIVTNDKTEISKSEDNSSVIVAATQPDKYVTSEKRYLTTGYEQILDDALQLQFKADSLNSTAAQLKKDMAILPDNKKPALKSLISENELLAAAFQKSADQKYSEANAFMNPVQEKILQKDSVKKSDVKAIKEAEKKEDTIKIIIPVVKKPAETFAFFEILKKPVSDPKEKILIDPEVPPGLIYRIQIAVFRNPVAAAYFKGITPVYGFRVAGSDKTNYYAGMFRRSSDAKKALTSVKNKGFRDAFITSFSGKKSVSADRAAILEKEWGTKPFINLTAGMPGTSIDTVTPTLIFRVEAIKSTKPLKVDIVDGIRKLSGSRGLDIQQLDDGSIAYLIGKFITFESAADYTGLLIRNGYPGARVVAFLGNNEIPVETAKQLFENLE